MAKRSDVPVFGPLHGLKIMHQPVSIAGPFCAELFAELGADVIWIESPYAADIGRLTTTNMGQSERRNVRSLCMDIFKGEGKETFLKLIKDVDIFFEGSRPGQYQKHGITDELLWEINPKLIIGHISGYGQYGDPDYVGRASYDPVAQAFGGFMYMNSHENEKPRSVNGYIGDYYTSLYMAFSLMSAYFNMLRTGKGESIDIAQFETFVRMTGVYAMDTFNGDRPFVLWPDNNADGCCWNAYKTKDDQWFYLLVQGALMKKVTALLGIPFGVDGYPAAGVWKISTPYGRELEDAITAKIASMTLDEAQKWCDDNGIPGSRIINFYDMMEHPHYKARGTLISWPRTDNGRIVTGSNIVPRFKNTECKVWRGCPTCGMDNEDILADIGCTPEQIQQLYNDDILRKGDMSANKYDMKK